VAKRLFTAVNWTPGTVADGSALASNTYMALKGGSTTQFIDVLEVEASGMAGASNPTPLTLARAGTTETTPTALANPNADGPMNPFTVALTAAPVSFVAAATGPTRSALVTDARLNLGINAFGGIIRWNASPTQQWQIYGNSTTLPGGLSVLSNQAYGTPGLVQAHIMYEPM
jgi:hypothetical protein